jgi:hypothetical protein
LVRRFAADTAVFMALRVVTRLASLRSVPEGDGCVFHEGSLVFTVGGQSMLATTAAVLVNGGLWLVSWVVIQALRAAWEGVADGRRICAT